MTDLDRLIILSIVTASISFTITESKLFLTLRTFLKSKNNFLGTLFSCGYCMSHWVAAILLLLYPIIIIQSDFIIIDYIITVFMISWIASFQWILLALLMKFANK